MNWDQLSGKWKQLAGAARASWAALTHDRHHRIAGEREVDRFVADGEDRITV